MTAAVLLSFLAVALGVVGTADLLRARRRVAGARSAAAPGRAVAALARLGLRLGVPSPPAGLARRIDAAGLPAAVGVAEVMAVKAGAAALALGTLAPLAAALPGRLGPLALAATPLAGFVAPDLWLARRARRRGRAMAVELADVLDLLRVAVEAGLSPTRALAEVGARRAGPLAMELRAAAARVALGVARAEALAQLARRCPVAGVEPLVAALLRAERHGAPLAPALIALAADARARRAQALREQAARAAPKIQLVVALMLVPAVMLVVGAALADALL
jgi:tight adherence protein C